MLFYGVGDVVQFNEEHKWCGSLGIIEEANENRRRYTIGVPIPEKGTAYIFVSESDHVIDYIGKAALMPKREEKGDDR